MQSFILPANGAATPKSIERKRKMAEAMLANGLDASPIASPWQGAARMANALVGGLSSRKADKQEAEGSMAAKEAMIKALNGGSKSDVIAAATNPFADNNSMELLGQQWKAMNPDPLKPTSEIQNYEYGLKNPGFAQSAGGGLFDSKSVEGQALNYLIQTQAITPDQAAQIGAGKPITGADGSMHFLTPSDIVQAAQQKLGAGGQSQGTQQAGIPLGPAKKPEAQIKGESRESGIASSVATLTQGATPDNPMPIFDDLGKFWNTVGAAMPGQTGRIILTPEGKQAVDATRNVIQNYIYTLSGAQAPDSEVNRQMEMVIPSVTDDTETIKKKKLRLIDMISTISTAAQGPGGQGGVDQTRPQAIPQPMQPQMVPPNQNDPLGLRQ